MSVNEKMTAIADAIRGKTGGTEPLGLDEMAVGVGEVYEAGRVAEHAVCEAVHFHDSFFGNGGKVLTANIPFLPDVLAIYAISPYMEAQGNAVRAFVMDSRACGKRSAILVHVNANKADGAKISSDAISGFLSYADGVLTVDISGYGITGVWSEDIRYALSAVRFADETVRGLVEEQIRLLPDTVPSGNSGTMTYNQERIDALFTQEEWAALLATKPNWTFSMI